MVAALSDGVVPRGKPGEGRAAAPGRRPSGADRRGHGDPRRGTTGEGEGERAVAAVGGLRDDDLTDGLVREATRRGAARRDTRTTDRRADRGKAGGNRLAHCGRVVWEKAGEAASQRDGHAGCAAPQPERGAPTAARQA